MAGKQKAAEDDGGGTQQRRTRESGYESGLTEQHTGQHTQCQAGEGEHVHAWSVLGPCPNFERLSALPLCHRTKSCG